MTDAPRHPVRRHRGVQAVALVAAVLVGALALAACGDEPAPGERTASPVPGFEYEACFGDAGSRTSLGPQFGETDLRTESDDGEGRTCVAVADTAAARQQGLMGVEDLQGFGGMLFVFEEEVEGGFHMEGTPMPLSIAWFDAEGELVSTAGMEPCLDESDFEQSGAEPLDCPSYLATGPYQFALELPQGDLPNMAVTDDSARLVLAG
jgi:uncharacterized membrane protein (UPF0127 family)